MGFDLGDLSAVEPSTGGGRFTVIPKGQYRLGVNDTSEEMPNHDGTGTVAYIEFAVVEGPFDGSTFRVYYNRKNDNQQSVDIAQKELSALGHAVGVFGGEADAMIGKTFLADVGIKPPSVNKRTGKQYGESNCIDKYYPQGSEPKGGPMGAAPPRPVAVAARPVAAASGAKPWAKRA